MSSDSNHGAGARPGELAVLRSLREATPATRWLLISDFGFNMGFYSLMPFLAGELEQRGVAAASIGLVLGVRTLCQQGLYLVGGAIADRTEYRSIITLGCYLRFIAFGLFAVTLHPVALIAAAALTGVAAALFTPAMKAYLAESATDNRSRTFALSAVLSEAGALTGPILGIALLSVGFSLGALAAGCLFLLWGLVLRARLPRRRGSEHGSDRTPWRAWLDVLGDRRFMAFSVALAGYAVLFQQLYLALPLILTDIAGGQAGVALAFVLSAVTVVFLQARVTSCSERVMSPASAMSVGLAVMGAAFLAPVIADLLDLGPALGTGCALVATVLLTLGTMIAFPYIMSTVAQLAGERQLGTYYGVFYLAGGLAATAGNVAVGALIDSADGRPGTPVWLLLFATGVVSAAGINAMKSQISRPRW
ncbi:MAG: MFS transporter [Proteobacteria bacterium]|nr:MFS transporter [Pseudomonadota bacterium]